MLKDKILKLRAKGKSYRDIEKKLKCSKATIAYHCSKKVKAYYKQARRRNRRKFTTELKEKFGGRCNKCGYNKCLDALQFHHRNPKTKTTFRRKGGQKTGVTALAIQKNQKIALREAKKCDLLCANCHFEIHSQLNPSVG